MKRALFFIVVLLTFLAMLLAGSAHAQEATATPNPTQAIETARAVIATPDFSSAIKYGDLGDITLLLGLAVLIALLFLLWIVDAFVLPKGPGG